VFSATQSIGISITKPQAFSPHSAWRPIGISITSYRHFNYQLSAFGLPGIGISITGRPDLAFIQAGYRRLK
jgi:hypothetical protein